MSGVRRMMWLGLICAVAACNPSGEPSVSGESSVSADTAETVATVSAAVVSTVPSQPTSPTSTVEAPSTTDVTSASVAPTASEPGVVVPVTQPPVSSAAYRFPGLSRVANVSMWFTLFWAVDNPAGNPAHLSDEELDRVVAHGFSGLRIPIDPELIADADGVLNEPVVTLLHDALARVHSRQLAAIVDLHIWDPDRWESPEQLARVARIWEQLAPRLSGYDPALTFLELYNEPGWWGDPAAWAPYQQSLYEVARAGAPGLPLIVSGPKSSWVDAIDFTVVHDDPNVVYTIHVYDPFPFTHQGADWTVEPGLVEAVGLPFPASPAACAVALDRQPTAAARATAAEYCAGGYDEAWVRERIEIAARWAQRHDVALFLGEFGVSPVADVGDAARWFSAVANAAEQHGIGWSIWSLDAAMGIRRASGWQTSMVDAPDAVLLDALGLVPATE